MKAMNKRMSADIQLQANLHGAKLDSNNIEKHESTIDREQEALLNKAIQGRLKNG